MTRSLDFWFEFASPYSFLSAARIAGLAAGAGVAVRWRPFLLGPIFAKQGWSDSPFNLYPAKGRYMWRDMDRRAARLGLSFRRPERFPANGLTAARTALVALDTPRGADFCQAVFAAQFAEGRDISRPAVLADCLRSCGLDPALLDLAETPEIKAALRHRTDMAQAAGIFGAPSFVVDGDLFWGDDRLEDAIDRAVGRIF